MFAVEDLVAFPPAAQAFANAEEAGFVVAEHGLELDMSMCTSCPRVSTTMQLPHLFSHKYCGKEFLEKGQEEWQMCQLISTFVKDNKLELIDATREYFRSGVVPAKTLMRYVSALSKRFQSPDALQIYLLARMCNAHTRVFFKHHVWSTVYSNASFYVAVNLALIGNEFVPLRSPEQGQMQCVIGEVHMFVAGAGAADSGQVSPDMSDNDSNFGEVSDSDADSEVLCEKLVQQCAIKLHRIPLYVAFPDLCFVTSVRVECLPLSVLFLGCIFHSEKKPRSQLFPGRVFKSTPRPNWTACTVPMDLVPRSTQMPGKVFSSHSKPVNQPSISSKLPGHVFLSTCKPKWKWTSCTVPKENVPLSVHRPGVMFVSQAKYSQQSSAPVPRHFQPVLSLTRIVQDTEGSGSPVLMFHCHVCSCVIEQSRAKLKCHVEVLHGLYTCRNAHCITAFKSASVRDIHSAVHIKKVHVCDKCGKQFSHRFLLSRHMMIHATKRQYKCNVCGRRYFCPQDLKEHVTTSPESEEFLCGSCSYKGHSQCALKQHALVHKEPALKCEWCSQVFRWRSQLATHHCEWCAP